MGLSFVSATDDAADIISVEPRRDIRVRHYWLDIESEDVAI